MIRQSQQLQKPEKRSGPRRRDQAGHMFDVRGEFHVDQPSSRRGRRTALRCVRAPRPPAARSLAPFGDIPIRRGPGHFYLG